MISDRELIERHASPEPNSGCWLWDGYLNKYGYGRLGRNRSERGAHRLAYRVYRGLIPRGLLVLHSCDMPCCVNPDHLFLGTHADNSKDCKAKGRAVHARGESQGLAKLTWEDVHKIRSLKEPIRSIANRYGIERSTVRSVLRGVTWNE
jgi:hypothetical protein